MSKVTIVSALYYIGRDRWKSSGFGPNNDRYKNWVKNLLSLDANIYFYVDDFYYDYVVDFRRKYDPEFKKTTIVRESLDSMYFYKKYFNDESCLMFSPEFRKRVWFKDSADMCYPIYHIINFTKIDFVKRASEVNPYNSDYFFWVDAGGMRDNFDQYENVKWPNERSEFLNDKIIHFSHNSAFEIYPNKDQYFLSQTRNIQGTAWIVPKNKIDHFFNLIDNQVSTIIGEKIVGSDEKVYDFLYKNNEELYQLVVCGWFKFFDVMKITEEEKKEVLEVDSDLINEIERGNVVKIGQKNGEMFMIPSFWTEDPYDSPTLFGSFTPRQPSIKKLVRQTVDKYNIKNDFEFYVWLTDWVVDLHKKNNYYGYQFFNDDYQKGFPDFMFLNQPENGLEDYTETINSFIDTVPETNKIGWIGDYTGFLRVQLSEYAKNVTDILDYVKVDFAGRTSDMYKNTPKYMTYQSQVNKWKYLLDIEGGGWSCRLKVLLNTPRIVFMVDRPYKEFWFKDLQPWKHYVPVKRDFSDLVENYWRLENDVELQNFIKTNVKEFCKNNLTLDSAHNRIREIIEECSTNKNIFLDLGTHNCQGLDHFVRRQYNMDDKWEIHTFEPNPLIDVESCVKQFTNYNIQVHRDAVWISNGKTIFGQYGDGTSQGSLIEETGGSRHYHDFFSETEVDTIDFLEFVNKFNKSDNIYIKMDVEWAEYNILRYMLDKGWPTNIKEIWIEFHGQNEQEFIDKSESLIREIQSKNTIVHRWI